MPSEELPGPSRSGIGAAPEPDESGGDGPQPGPGLLDPAAPESPGAPFTELTERAPSPHRRLTALGEVVLCSGFPTQATLVVLLGMLGAGPTDGSGDLSLAFVVTLSLVDAALILALVWMFMRAHGEQPVAVMVGRRPIRSELLLGLALVPAALLVVAAAFAVLSRIAPELRNVPENPLEALITTPAAAVTFAAVAMVAGGLREEVQRAFILRRFEQHLGGAAVGLVVFSVAFGLGHLVQGRDAAIITGLLGALWGVLYLVRRSMVAPFACHSGFNAMEVLIAYVGGGGG